MCAHGREPCVVLQTSPGLQAWVRVREDQDVRAGDVFMEITEKTQVPGFRFLQWVEFGAWQRQKKAPGEKNCASEDQDLGACDMLTRIQGQNGNPRLNGKGLHNETVAFVDGPVDYACTGEPERSAGAGPIG
jgi:hypothetical protein